MSDFFTDISKTLDILTYIPNDPEEVLPLNSSIAQSIECYKKRPSIFIGK